MMAKLEELTVGARVSGLDAAGIATIVAVKWYDHVAVEVTFHDQQGHPDNRILYRDAEERLSLVDSALPWSFTADSAKLRLASEAYRIHLAHLFDPYLAVHTSAIEPLPHQISAVYEAMLPRQPLRYILADDPGAGKTVMTGLLLKELMIRGDVKRCLIVCPGNLTEQWQDELWQKFHIRFQLLTSEQFESAASGNIFQEVSLCIARLDKLARNDRIQEKLRETDWDLVVCDEAHKMSASYSGNKADYTKRFLLGRLLSETTRHFLLLTATPHNGKEKDFQLFLSLIDPDRFEGIGKTAQQKVDTSDIMRRLVKEELLRFDGTPLFPERIACTINYDLTDAEEALYNEVTSYVREEFNRADNLSKERKNTVGFALTILQRRLASSPEAIYQSLRRRRIRLEERLSEQATIPWTDQPFSDALGEDWDDLPAREMESNEEIIADQASAASTIAELEAEIATLQRLEKMANEVRSSGTDKKWYELSHLLQDNEKMYGQNGQREKLIIFTEHKDTLFYLAGKIRSLLGDDRAVVVIYGGLSRDDRREAETRFKQDSEVRVMVATDAAGEGINLQRAHLMINYDLPWNPNRLEQRFGRIHRIGQTKVCYLWNLVSRQTREGEVFQRLFDKLEQERQSLGGKVFDILGKVSFDNRPLRELLVEAIRKGSDPETRARLNQVVDSSLDQEKLRQLLEENALTGETMDPVRVAAIREDMERMEARKLQPHFVESFFLAAFQQLGGSIYRREAGRYEIRRVPAILQGRGSGAAGREPVLERYERICFTREGREIPDSPPAAMICPGHPLLDVVIGRVLEQNRDAMKQGCIFVDESDDGQDPRLLFYIESTIQDGVMLANGQRRAVSRQLNFVELTEDGTAKNAGYAPYLDYRPPTPEEAELLLPYIQRQNWLRDGIEDRAKGYAISSILPRQFEEVRARKQALIDKTRQAVKERLTAAIQYWDYKAWELRQKEDAGKANARLNSQNAARRAEELAARLDRRMKELDLEQNISSLPPSVVSGAVVIPQGLLDLLEGHVPSLGQGDRRAMELAGMAAVLAIETRLGFVPRDVSAENCGYDIESRIEGKGGPLLRFIEVKARQAEAETVTVTANEILIALNKPQEYILALVLVDGGQANVTYLRRPFRKKPEWTAASVNYRISDLLENGEIILQEEVQL